MLEGLDVESIRAMVKSLDLDAPAEINEAATDYFAGPIGGKATHEMGEKLVGILTDNDLIGALLKLLDAEA